MNYRGDRKSAVDNEIRICTLILNTSDYCYTTTSQVIMKKIFFVPLLKYICN